MPLLTASDLAAHFAGLEDDALEELFQARPDLLHPAPRDFLSLAVRAQSELSLRQHLQRLDAHTLRVLLDATEQAASGHEDPTFHDDAVEPERDGVAAHDRETQRPAAHPGQADHADHRTDHDADQKTLSRLCAHALVLPAEALHAIDESRRPARPRSDRAGTAESPLTLETPLCVPANLPHVLDSIRPSQPMRRVPPEPPAPSGPAVPSNLVQNASLSAVGELLSAVEDLLTVLDRGPATTLRTGGVGMRELRRLSAERTGERPTADTEAGETGWLLELAAAAALIKLDVDTGLWRPSGSAEPWRRAPRHRRHQLLVSGWLLSPRSPLLLRGPHPLARIAPALTQDRQRGDAPTLRERLLRTASCLAAQGRHIWELDLPDGDLPPGDALRGTLAERLAWDRPLLTSRVRPLLAPMVREAERLGLLAAGTVAAAGTALVQNDPPSPPEDEDAGPRRDSEPLTAVGPLTTMAAAVEEALPPLAETIHLQSDLTAVPAGPLVPEVARALSEGAEKEARGGVPTYRFTIASVSSALTHGWTAESFSGFLRRHSSGELPSPLRALIDDAARLHRPVRLGRASSWLVEHDPEARAALLAQPDLQRLNIRQLEGSVLICDASPRELATALDDCGVPTHREDEDLREHPGPGWSHAEGESAQTPEGWALFSSPWQQSPVRTVTLETLSKDSEVLAQAITSLRAAPKGRPSGASASAELAEADVVATLRDAVRQRRTVRIRRAGADGEEHTLIGVPTSMNAGRVRLRRDDREDESVLLLHRVTSVTLAGQSATPEAIPAATKGYSADAPHRNGEGD